MLTEFCFFASRLKAFRREPFPVPLFRVYVPSLILLMILVQIDAAFVNRLQDWPPSSTTSPKRSVRSRPPGIRAVRRLFLFCTVILGLIILGGQARADTQTDIRPEPGGKRLLFVDGNDIRPEPGGKRLLCIDDHSIRPTPNGKVLLYMDDDDVRDAFGGIRIAFWDGSTLRRRPGGKILLFVDGDDIRTEAGGKRLYFIDGPKLSLEQLTAVLYQLKPELFTLNADDTAKLKKEMADNEAESDAAAKSAASFAGQYDLLGYQSSDGKSKTGKVTVTKQGKYYALIFATGDTPAWAGVAVTHTLANGTTELWAAVAPGAAASLGIYEAAGGKLTGTWIPANAADDPAVLGNETLVGPGGAGAYKIESGQLPNAGAKYTGAMNIDASKANAGSDATPYRFRWATGTTGAAFSVGNTYAVSAGWGADYEIIRMHLYLGNLVGNFVGKNNEGSFILSK